MTHDHDVLLQAARSWRDQDPDPATRDELARLIEADDRAGLADRFDTRLDFGTAGLRGVVGAGPNRMNRAVVRRVTAALCRYVAQHVPEGAQRGVVVGYDGRTHSRELADETARVIIGAGLTCLMFDRVSPTPVTAFAVVDLRAAAGAMITASHNPPEYNGYKAYWEDGAQVIPPHDRGIADLIDWAGPLDRVVLGDLEAARAAGRLRTIGPDLDERYLAGVAALHRRPTRARGLKIAYTAMHGVGGRYVERALAQAGAAEVHVVPEQHQPDGRFPTVRFPNPEEPGAMDLVLAVARGTGADIALANDPDADRLAVAAPDRKGQWRMLDGNQIGALLGDWLLRTDPGGDRPPLVVTTIVSAGLLGAMAQRHGARYAETLTGFKWLANAGRRMQHEARFIFGYEEALGYSVGTLVRDKDGVSGAAIFAELAAALKEEGLTVHDRLEALAREYGLFVTEQHSVTRTGGEGAAVIAGAMAALREDPPCRIGRRVVASALDGKAGTRRDPRTGATSALDLPPADVLIYELDDGSKVRVRPSGTEPKIKFYFEVRQRAGARESLRAAEARARRRIETMKREVLGRAGLA